MVLRVEALRERLAKLEVHAALQRSVRDFTDFEADILAWLERRPA